VFGGYGPVSAWHRGQLRDDIIKKISKKLQYSKFCKNKTVLLYNTEWSAAGLQEHLTNLGKTYNYKNDIITRYNNIQNLLTSDYIICYGLCDWISRNNLLVPVDQLKHKKIIDIGYTTEDYGIFIDYWAISSFLYFKKYSTADISLQKQNILPFLCYQFKPRYHRELLLINFYKHKIINKGIITFSTKKFYNNTTDEVPLTQFTAEERKLRVHLGSLKKINFIGDDNTLNYPNNYDINPHWESMFKLQKGCNDIYTLGPLDVWRACFLNIVSETLMPRENNFRQNEPRVFWSEKVYKPIIGMRPFIINGRQDIYTKLKKLGFDIFEDLWCGYNLIESKDTAEHTELITHIVKHYCNMSSEELYNLYISLLPRLEYNRDLFYKHAQNQLDIIENIHVHFDNFLTNDTSTKK
jgi:hypothetical protein